MTRNTRGFTLAELLVATVVMGILGLALTQILIGDSRFVSKVEAMMNARQIARAAMNTMGVELQMVSQGGLTAASRTGVRARVPYAFGILCERVWTGDRWIRYAVLVPTDSLTYANATANGMAWRNTSGNYTFHNRNPRVRPGNPARMTLCANEGIRTDLPKSQFIRMRVFNDTLTAGDVFYLYQDIRYRFYTSVEVPGRLGLWRRRSGSIEELLTPFDPSSGFRFYVAGGDTSRVAPPADLSTVTGLEMVLVGASEVTPQGSPAPPSFEIRTRVNFLNRR
jgi:prepilin-type N-terminal cleavage/methylation domain-containing protein